MRVRGPIFSERKATMKSLCVGLLVAALAISTGCDGKSTSGGPGATNTSGNKKPQVGQSENSFKLSPPKLATRLKQGEAKDDTIGIDRGKNFDQDVTLKFEGLPKGVTIDPASPTIKHGDKEAKVTVKAAGDAAVGDFTVKVVGKPNDGPEAANELKLTISQK